MTRPRKFKENFISILLWMSAFSVFIPFALFVLTIYPLFNPRRIDPLIKAWGRLMVRVAGIRVCVEGAENLRPDQPCLFMSNHVNLFDGFLLYGYIPNYFRGVELDLHFQWPVYGTLIRRLGVIPISRTQPRSALKSLKRAGEILASGTSILIMPEGGRTLTGRFKPFKRGAFYLAKQANVDIVPMVMVGAFRVNRKGSLLVRPGNVTLRIGPPMPAGQIRNLQVNTLMCLIRNRMLEMFQAPVS